MYLDIFHLEARSAFHFGQRGVGMEESADHAPSDTLFSALCHAFRLVESNAALENDLLHPFVERDPLFLLGGGFPYIRMGDEYLRFYPVPANFQLLPIPRGLEDGAKEHLARAQKARWMSEGLFFDWLAGQPDVPTIVDNTVHLKLNNVLVYKAEAEVLRAATSAPTVSDDSMDELRLWQVSSVPHVAVDRVTSASNIYQVGRLSFMPGGGLWCGIVHCHPEMWDVARTAALLAHVGQFGLGGERSSGYGRFEVQDAVQTWDVPAPQDASRFVTLSHYHPRYDERDVLGAESAYDLSIRRGWMSSLDGGSLRRRPVRMITAGSVLHSLGSTEIYGELVDTTPNAFEREHHPVWRYGYALGIGMATRLDILNSAGSQVEGHT